MEPTGPVGSLGYCLLFLLSSWPPGFLLLSVVAFQSTIGILGSNVCDGKPAVHSLQLAIINSIALVMPGQKYSWRASISVFDLPVCCMCRLESTFGRAATGTTILPWYVRNIPWTARESH